MAEKATRINETDTYDPFTARGPVTDGNVVPINATPADDAILAINLAKMIAADTLLDGAKTDHKAIKDHVEAKGINVKAHKLAGKIIASGEVAEHIALFSDTLKYLKIRGRPVQSSQLDLLTTEDDRAPLDDRAREEGRYAGIMGYSADSNPYALDSEAGQIWLAAWYGGEEERKLILALEPKDSETIKGGSEEQPSDGDPFEGAEQREAAE